MNNCRCHNPVTGYFAPQGALKVPPHLYSSVTQSYNYSIQTVEEVYIVTIVTEAEAVENVPIRVW